MNQKEIIEYFAYLNSSELNYWKGVIEACMVNVEILQQKR